MGQMSVFDAVTGVRLSDVASNARLDTEVRKSAADLIAEGYETADVLAVSADDGLSVVLVPNGEPRASTPVWKRLAERITGSEDGRTLSAGAEMRLISRNIAKGLASVEHPFTRSANDLGAGHGCLVCGSTAGGETCAPLDKAVGFPFTFAPSAVEPDASVYDDSGDGAVSVQLDPSTVAAILSAVQADETPDDGEQSSDSSSEVTAATNESPTGPDWRDGLDPWQVELADSLDEIVDEMGRVPSHDAGYVDNSPYGAQNCSNCIAMGETGCDWVAVSCSPTGWCKFNITPVVLKSAAGDIPGLDDGEALGDDSGDDTRDFEDSDDFGVTMPVLPLPDVSKSADGEDSTEDPTDGSEDQSEGDDSSTPGVIKKDAEMRYTLGPWYVPWSADAHGEWTDPAELQMALHGYIRSGDRDIRLQHNTDIVAGEWVEAMQWPYDVKVPMVNAGNGQVSEVSFPAGTVFLGVVWSPWAWELVKQGKIGGYSMGGTGAGVEVDMPGPESIPGFETFRGR